MLTIENGKFRATISEMGAELQSLVNRKDDYEFIWSDKGRGIWNRHAPILFPAIGKSNDDQYMIDGQLYPMHQHGFARDFPFTIVKQEKSSATFSLKSNDETRTMFPFDFELLVTYSLSKKGLDVAYTVKSVDKNDFAFSLGSHPGFQVALNDAGDFDDYRLMVSPVDGTIKQFDIDPVPFRDGDVSDLDAAEGNEIPLSHELLDDGLIILDNPEIQSVSLSSPNQKHSVTLQVNDFPYLAIWSPEHKQAPFICVEPFNGLPDEFGDPSDLFHKQGNVNVKARDQKQMHYQIDLI